MVYCSCVCSRISNQVFDHYEAEKYRIPAVYYKYYITLVVVTTDEMILTCGLDVPW